MSSKSPKQKPGSAPSGDPSRRRNIILASVVAVAVVAVAVIVIASSGGSDTSSSSSGDGAQVQGVTETTEMFDGIAQKGNTLGNPDAKVTLVEFADYQCPFCKEFALTTLPVIVNDYVRTGKVRMELRTLAFIGPDSQTAAYAGAAAGVQNKEWTFTELFYHNQGEENSGYVTDQFIDDLYTAAGVNVADANAFRKTPAAKVPLAAANKEAEKFGIASTPSFLIGETGGPYTKLEVNLADAAGFKAAIDELLK